MVIVYSPRTWTVAVASAVAFTAAVPRPVAACDCVRLKPLSPDVRREAPVIFLGTVIGIIERTEHTTTTSARGAQSSVRPIDRRVVFRVTTAWRGVTRPSVDVLAEISDCMFPFEIGRSYVVFARRASRGRAWTSICMRTAALERADDVIRELGAPSYRASDERTAR